MRSLRCVPIAKRYDEYRFVEMLWFWARRPKAKADRFGGVQLTGLYEIEADGIAPLSFK